MDLITPTAERASQAGSAFEPARHDPQMRTYKPARVLSRWEVLERSGRLTPEHCDAGQKYERHAELASRATVTPSYGQRSAEGTPASQLDESAFQSRAAAWIDYYALHRDAVRVIGLKNAEFLADFIRGETLFTLGGGGRKGASIHRAHARLITILEALQDHYGQKRRRDPYP